MPLIQTKGNISAQGYGWSTTLPERVYIEDVFSTWLYTGNGSTQGVNNGIQLSAGATSPGWFIGLNATGAQSQRDSSNNVYFCASGNLIKYSSAGSLLWQRAFNGGFNSNFTALATTSAGDSYIAGNQGSPNGFGIVKYNTSGTLQWQRTLAATYGGVARGIALDSSENVYFCGSYTSPDTGDHGLGIVAKYNSSGTLQWQRRISAGSSQSDSANVNGIAVDSSGNVYVCGNTRVFASDTYFYFIQKYDTNGTILFQRQITPATTSNVVWNGISLSSDGSDVYVVGSLGTNFNSYILKYNSSGILQWQRQFNNQVGSNTGVFTAVHVDSSNNVYAAGTSSTTEAVIVKYNSSGSIQWQRAITRSSGSGTFSVPSINTDSAGNIILSIQDGSSGALAKLPADGSGLGIYNVGTVFTYISTNYGTSTPTQTGTTSGPGASTSTLTGATSSFTSVAGSLTSSTTALVEGGTAAGGLVWLKSRSGATDHALYDSVRGPTFDIASNLATGQTTQTQGLTGFLSNGFSIGSLAKINTNNAIYTSWTFREQPCFFDIVTYTGNGANRTISHNLGSVPGCIMVKRTDTTDNWLVYHRSLGNTNNIILNSNAGSGTNATIWNNTSPTSTVFSLGTNSTVNANGGTYVAYLFAHDAGGFGAAGADNVISCGSYVGNGSATGPTVTLGWEPQWILIKRTDGSGLADWYMLDNMRGLVVNNADSQLSPNLTSAESSFTAVSPTATGFQIITSNNTYNASGSTYIYIAIRRGPMRTPTSGTTVFSPTVYTGTNVNNRLVNTTIAPDMVWVRQRNDTVLNGMVVGDRLRAQPYLLTGSTAAEVTSSTAFDAQLVSATEYGTAFSSMNGFWCGTDATAKLNVNTTSNNHVVEAFKRAPGFFDTVYYAGTGVAGRTVSHNLGVVPELMMIKTLNAVDSWGIYFAPLGNTSALVFNTANGTISGSALWNSTSPTSSVFTVGSSNVVNGSGRNYTAYLFASCSGVSRVGNYTGTGSTLNIDCGFATGARFVLIKRTDASGDWFVWDSARGIVAANDPYLTLNGTAAEVTTTDWVDTLNAGFQLSSAVGNNANINAASYVFFAIA